MRGSLRRNEHDAADLKFLNNQYVSKINGLYYSVYIDVTIYLCYINYDNNGIIDFNILYLL